MVGDHRPQAGAVILISSTWVRIATINHMSEDPIRSENPFLKRMPELDRDRFTPA